MLYRGYIYTICVHKSESEARGNQRGETTCVFTRTIGIVSESDSLKMSVPIARKIDKVEHVKY